MLSWAGDEEYGARVRAKVARLLDLDGYRITETGRIVSSRTGPVTDLPLDQLSDPAALMGHLQRMEAAAATDPPLAISQAKALIEATTKQVLTELGVTYSDTEDMPALVRAAQKALALHPDSLAPDPKGADIISKKILGSLAGVALGLVELRNLYGPDHGRAQATGPLGPRHAHLAIGAAGTYCRMLLETLEARRASS
jgi:predicted RNA-binding Zn ribbon-like protein